MGRSTETFSKKEREKKRSIKLKDKKEKAEDTKSDKKFLPDMSIEGEGGDNIIAKKKDAEMIQQKLDGAEAYSD